MGATDQGILSHLLHNQGQLYMQSLRTLSIRGSHFLSCRPHPILYRPLGMRLTEMDVRIRPCRGFAILNLIEVGPLLRMDECYDSTRSLDKSPSSEYHHSHERETLPQVFLDDPTSSRRRRYSQLSRDDGENGPLRKSANIAFKKTGLYAYPSGFGE